MLQMLNSQSAIVRKKTIDYINKLEQQLNGKANLLLSIYEGGQNAILASKKLTELEVAKAVAEWIDYGKNSKGSYNVSEMVSTIDKEEKLIFKIKIPGDTQEYIEFLENVEELCNLDCYDVWFLESFVFGD